MEWHRLDEIMDYHSYCEAQMGYEATGKCDCDTWMLRRKEEGLYVCTICGSSMTDEEHDERFPIPF